LALNFFLKILKTGKPAIANRALMSRKAAIFYKRIVAESVEKNCWVHSFNQYCCLHSFNGKELLEEMVLLLTLSISSALLSKNTLCYTRSTTCIQNKKAIWPLLFIRLSNRTNTTPDSIVQPLSWQLPND